MWRVIRLVLRLATTAAAAALIVGGIALALGLWVMPLRWTTTATIDAELERSEWTHERWGSDIEIEVTRSETPLFHHAPFSTERAEGVEPGEHPRELSVTLYETRLEAGECVAFRIVTAGSDWVMAYGAAIEEDGVEVAAGYGWSGRDRMFRYIDLLTLGELGDPAHVALGWCSPLGGDLVLRARYRMSGGSEPRPLEGLGGDHVAHLFIGRTRPPVTLDEGLRHLTPEGTEVWRAHRHPLDGGPVLGDPITSSWRAGVALLPATRPVWSALVDASAHETGVLANPRTDAALRDGGPPFGRRGAPYPRGRPADRSAPVILWGGETRRVLAAVDLGELGADCVRIAFTRGPDVGTHGPRVSVVHVPSGRLRVLDIQDGTSVDSACPARGLRLYVVSQRVRSEYTIRILASEPTDEGQTARASDYDGPLPVEGERECANGDTEACERAGLRLALWPAMATRREHGRQLLSDACAAGRTDACDGHALSRGARNADMNALERLCGTGESAPSRLSCMRLGDAYRAAALADPERRNERNRAAAMDAYRRACSGGIEGGCRNLRARYP